MWQHDVLMSCAAAVMTGIGFKIEGRYLPSFIYYFIITRLIVFLFSSNSCTNALLSLS